MAGLHGGQQAGAVIERKQHVVDRRAVSHGNISLDKEQKQQARRLPTKPLFPQLPPGPSCVTAEPKASDSCKIGPGTPGERVYLAREASLFTSVIYKGLETAAEAAILPGRLLKWAVRLGRRAVAAGIWVRLSCGRSQMSLMGRSQAVRQRILIPPFGGSIPPAPAKGQHTEFFRETALFSRGFLSAFGNEFRPPFGNSVLLSFSSHAG